MRARVPNREDATEPVGNDPASAPVARPSRTSLARRILLATIGTLTAFGVAEVTLRLTRPEAVFEWRSGRNPMSRWALVDAFCAYRGRPGDYLSGRKTINADGFFSTPEIPAAPAAPDTVRIAFLGGSSTAGTVPYLGDDETWPWRTAVALRERLADAGVTVEFVNAAAPGYSTFESYGRLWARLRAFRPDLVVVYHGWNDLYYFRDADATARWRVRGDGSWGFDAEARFKRVDRTPGWARWSVLLSTAHVLAFGDAPRGETDVGAAAPGRGGDGVGPALASTFDPRAVDVFADNVRLMLAAQEVLGFELHVAKQATLIVPDLAPELRERCGYRLHGFDHDAHVAAYDAIYRAIDDRVPADRIVDCTPVSGDPDALVDHVHLSAAGAERIAAIMADHLEGPVRARAARAAPR